MGSVDTDAVGLSGVQPKVSAAMWLTPANTTLGPAILKLNPPTGYPRLVENEHFFMRMAVDCGLRAAKTRLLHDAEGRRALLVDRFDRRRNPRIPQEDACQVAGVFPASKYRIHAETALVEDRGAEPRRQLRGSLAVPAHILISSSARREPWWSAA
jgi:serine/threonine-protein kinase HipA